MPGLTSMHTLWLREHNGIANTIKENTEGLTNDEIFQEARQILIAEYQHVIYAEFLVAVLGSAQITLYELGTERSTYKDGNEPEYSPVILMSLPQLPIDLATLLFKEQLFHRSHLTRQC